MVFVGQNFEILHFSRGASHYWSTVPKQVRLPYSSSYISSSMNHSDPGAGGSVLFHTHTFSRVTHTYALLQLPFFTESDVGCLYLPALGKNPVIACSCVCRLAGSLAIYTIGIVPACCISCCIGTCWSGICGDPSILMGLADVPCV